MKIDVAKKDLQIIREIIWAGRAHYGRMMFGIEEDSMFQREYDVGKKLIRKVNMALKSVHGHDCHGDDYL